MIIRQAKIEDLDQAIDLLNEFKEESLKEYDITLDLNHIRATVEQYVKHSFVAEDVGGKIVGIIAGQVMKVPSVPTPIYLESVWYVSKAHRRIGVYMLKTLEEKCRAEGIGHIILAHTMNSKAQKLEEFYTRNGFVPYEINYIKKL